MSALGILRINPYQRSGYVCAKLLQSCLTLCNPMDCSLPGSSVHGISQARIPEWVAISFSRASSQPRDRTRVFCGSCIAGRFFTAESLGKPRGLDRYFSNNMGASLAIWGTEGLPDSKANEGREVGLVVREETGRHEAAGGFHGRGGPGAGEATFASFQVRAMVAWLGWWPSKWRENMVHSGFCDSPADSLGHSGP